MRSSILGVGIVLCLVLVYSPAIAAEGSKSMPNLVGTWTGKEKAHFHKATREAVRELRVTEQDGAYFRGFRSWEHTDKKEAHGDVGGKKVHKATEPIIGVIGFDGKTIYLVEHGDWGIVHARLVGPDTIEAIYVESGPAAAIFRTLYKRKR